MQHPVITLTQALIRRQSLSPDDAGCQQLITELLQPLGFCIEAMPFGETLNLWAYHGDPTGCTVLFAGHTDIVPPGDATQWHYPPFAAELDQQGVLHGRGAADMKSGLAAMVHAAAEFVKHNPAHPGRVALLITSDEEAAATDGTVKVVETLQQRQERVDYCIVGEPSSDQQFGDQIKNGRRGSITANLTIHGVQGHVAYPQLADNPVHRFAPALQELVSTEWDQGNAYFPPTTMQIANINAGTGAENVIPGDLQVQFNFRYSSELTHTQIQQRVTAILDKHQLRYTLNWRHSGEPFLTPQGQLTAVASQVIANVTGISPQLSTSGGTSDGRFIAKMGCQLIEFGVRNQTIHKVNEQVASQDIVQLTQIYQQIIEQLLLEM